MGTDPMEAILASMAAATGNAAPSSDAHSKTKAKKQRSDAAAGLKRAREAESSDDIWNPSVEQELADEWLAGGAAAAVPKVTPAAEIARQQTVRHLCARIRRAGEELGIAKLPNSAYETWQFSSKLTVAEADPLLPHAESDYSGLLEELVKAGATKGAARKVCKALTKEADRLLRKFRQQDVGSSQRRHVKVARVGGDEGYYHLTYGKAEVKLTAAHLAKLRDMFARRREDAGEQWTPRDEREFESALFCLLLRYDSLDGGGFQVDSGVAVGGGDAALTPTATL